MAFLSHRYLQLPSPLVNTRGMYLTLYMAYGAFLPFINLYYERLGLTGTEIGILTALPVLVISTSSFFWGALADAYQLHRRVLNLALFLVPLTVLLLSQAGDYATIIPIVLVYAFFSSPVVPLLDSSALEIAQTHNRSYGELRVWGSLGWSISSWLVGLLIERLNIHWLFYCYILFLGVTFILSFFQPARVHVWSSSIGHGLQRLIRRDLVIFLLSVFLLAITSNAVNSFFSLYMDQIGAKEGLIGFSWALSALSEIPLMFYSGAVLKRIGARHLLIIAFILYIARWFLYSLIHSPVLALLVQVLQGISFAAFLTGGIAYMNERTPDGLTTTAQAIYNSVTFGLAAIAGSLVGGYLYDVVGMTSLFRILGLVALAAFGLFLLTPRSGAENRYILQRT